MFPCFSLVDVVWLQFRFHCLSVVGEPTTQIFSEEPRLKEHLKSSVVPGDLGFASSLHFILVDCGWERLQQEIFIVGLWSAGDGWRFIFSIQGTSEFLKRSKEWTRPHTATFIINSFCVPLCQPFQLFWNLAHLVAAALCIKSWKGLSGKDCAQCFKKGNLNTVLFPKNNI